MKECILYIDLEGVHRGMWISLGYLHIRALMLVLPADPRQERW